MKKLFLLLFVLSSSIAFSQATSDDEYNYLTKGYSVQITSGLDMKQGYTMVDKGNVPLDLGAGQSVNVKYLYRTSGNVYAGALLIFHGKGADKYFCVPNQASGPGVWNKTLQDVQAAFGADKSGYEVLMWAAMHNLGNQ